ncbi:metallophosphoesterase [Halorubrum ezzemoulense]|jgi:3',5'-cyclic AMP phosphodiesterase CpdA|uniref:Metallophosphoesterase n=1 Tax=Halorubrum ezzemoulense TaxID=337243 RepID=A0A256JF29_HALEZ|nr:metallophosphoesterase [Halorubrum ezzemoulense]MDB2237520.1 metallophosphoesterase [Halorubrum ezzemoulense]MDB2240881.1 metallophosphoesterase [Halorubrum ezzemoulense]MDB2243240.1 metallophosphoesterase [Halorubrum ezzemoulense]MDB2248986.1 metallophosphoesterase [Halorubrum ezzemoulense]MDB2251311.1 metallophosphoesterase [Halorubrum ezzemoulense]
MGRFALFPDVHMRSGHAAEIERELRDALEAVSADAFDRIFVLGDLIEDDGSADVDEANVERVREIFADAPVPVTYLLGNHDVETLTRAELTSLLGQDRFHGVIETDDVPIVYLDSTKEATPGARGELGSDQREWLAGVCAEYDDPLFLSHHPLGTFDISDNDWFRHYPERAFLSDRKETLRVIEGLGSGRGTISGHIHQSGFANFRNMAHVSVNAFSKEVPGKPLTGTYADVTVGDRITVDVTVGGDTVTSYTIL